MIYKNTMLHGIGETVPIDESAAVRLQRVPESVRLRLEAPAQSKVLNPAGSEIRFVFKGDDRADRIARITLSSAEGTGTAEIFNGTFYRRDSLVSIGPTPVTIEVTMPEGVQLDRIRAIPQDIASEFRFHPDVCRLVLRGGNIILHNIEGDIRPPEKHELPKKTMLAYGTSITHGTIATSYHLTYVAQTAWRLNSDLLNFGVGGACRAEKAFADYLAALPGWDFAIFGLSVNMLNQGFSAQAFRERVSYFIRRVGSENEDKPIFCISIFPYFGDWAAMPDSAKATPDEYRRVLAEVVDGLELPNVHLISGPDVLKRIDGFSLDLIHPGDFSMIDMGENLAAKIQQSLEERR